MRWSKNGGPAGPLPAGDTDAAGDRWSNLAGNPEGRAACGWAPATVPEKVTLAQARMALELRGELEAIDAWVETQPRQTQIYWKSSYLVRRNASVLLAATAARGLTEADVDELFFVAEGLP